MKYEVIICWSQANDAFIAEVPGCMADGATKAAALEAIEVVAKEWVATARRLGRKVPRPRGRLLYA